MNRFTPALTDAFDKLLATRERELCALLAARDEVLGTDAVPRGEVSDFKDAAGEQSLTEVDAAQAEQAAMELEQVLAARRRLQDGDYGVCLECGSPIPLDRLKAMPAAPYCIACQSLRELRHPGH
ncbi:TraR/DksA family transcriptional regulator [Caenimonas aquaedulcis]|uniref:TraR/DksA family transcriptional regulator n=1 Tax=Caenimonas aquaedulcis TaxID=2793270 RepID=A0A931MIJ1_9BURK|nr:TraR/DksA family transcriptional regulator [Caenimonas aquaedulcis]MBG9390196.1 TraR/DksA family transcriptional regulator [Caenimonas aquaedulcis]